jgi:peptidoglycan pentaglycine glycine transferase (the first glycine)
MSIQVTHIIADRREEWDTFVAREPSFALLQSWAWGEYKEKTGWRTYRIAVEKQGRIVAGAQVLIKPAARGLVSVVYIPRGPLVNWEDKETAIALCEAIHREAHRHKAICMRIEPPLLHSSSTHSRLQSLGFQHVKHTSQPRCTMIVDLPEDMDELLMALPSSTRKNIRRSERKGVTVDIADESHLPAFYRIMKVTGVRANFPIRTLDYYGQKWQTFNRSGQSQIFIARYKDQIIAAQMAFYFGRHAATFHGGSLDQYKSLKAGHLMMWETMCWARERDCCTFDLWGGIPDEVGELTARGEPIPEGKKGGLWGIYHHKRAFRGKIVYYVGAYDYVYRPLLYRTVEFVTSRLGSVDKLARVGDYF